MNVPTGVVLIFVFDLVKYFVFYVLCLKQNLGSLVKSHLQPLLLMQWFPPKRCHSVLGCRDFYQYVVPPK